MGLNPDETTIAELLKDKWLQYSYFWQVALRRCSKFQPRKQGFDEYFGILYSNDMWPKHPQQGTVFNFPEIKLYENETPLRTLEDQTFLTGALTDKAVAFIKKNKNNPFFIYLPHPQPHVPLFASKNFKATQKRGLYGDVISEIDNSVGQILKTLKMKDLRKDDHYLYIR